MAAIKEQPMTIGDLSEMLQFCYFYEELGHKKVQLDTEHAVEILQRLIKWETQNVPDEA